MIELFPLENYPALRSSRRVLRYVVVWCASGEISLQIDENQYVLRSDEVVTITSGQVHFLQKEENVVGWVLEFSLDFFCKDDTDIELIFHNGLFCHFAQNEVIPVHDRQTVNNIFLKIKAEIEEKNWQYGIAIHAQIELLLVAINRSKIARGDEIWKPDALFLKFLEEVRANFKQHPPLDFFARKLGTTEAKLNEFAKQFTGKTAQQVVASLIASEAKRLLGYEKLSVKEVAAALGFDDPFYFSHFFKKHMGVSPKAWRGIETSSKPGGLGA
jgi:AraC family transcriptional activator of pobA